MATERTRRDQQPSGWAVGGVTFAAAVLMLIGFFQLIAGLTAIFNDDFFVVTRNYTFDLDASAWGWIHLLFGVLLLFTAGAWPPALAGRWSRRYSWPRSARWRTSSSSPTTPSGRSSDRARRVGDLVAHTPGCDRGDLDPPPGPSGGRG